MAAACLDTSVQAGARRVQGSVIVRASAGRGGNDPQASKASMRCATTSIKLVCSALRYTQPYLGRRNNTLIHVSSALVLHLLPSCLHPSNYVLAPLPLPLPPMLARPGSHRRACKSNSNKVIAPVGGRHRCREAYGGSRLPHCLCRLHET
jgi:hypothetical protein